VKTIAHILPFPSVGGTEHATLRIAKAVDASRFTSVAFGLPEAEAVKSFFGAAGVPFSVFEPAEPSYRDLVGYLRAARRLAGEFKRRHVDLVHCADLLAAHYAALAGRIAGVPVLCHVRNRFADRTWRECSFLWPVDKFVFVSRNTWSQFACRVANGRGVVVYDGIDSTPFSPAADDARSVREELGFAPDTPIVGMLARVTPQKDYTTLIKAARRVIDQRPDVRFVVAGDHATPANRSHYEQVQRQLAEHDVGRSFVFTGYRGDVQRILNALDVFVLSTHWEGLPLVILEAMSSGKPVVATAVDGIPEIVEHERTGLLVAHENDTQLAAHLLTLLNDQALADRLGAAGRELVRARFTLERFAANMTDVYAQLLNA
jgi:glycosyltransferase involved in cell wall biosynthesis